MVFESVFHRAERLARDQQVYPELGVGDFGDIFAVDALRREEGREPTSIGAAMEFTWANPEEADAAPRGESYNPYSTLEEAAPRGSYEPFWSPPPANPFLAMQAQESQAVFDRNAQQTSINPLAAGLTMFGGIGHNLDRPRGALFAGLESGAPIWSPTALRAGFEGFQSPQDYGGGDMLRRQGMGDTDLIGSLSARDLLGGAADLAFDPLNLVGGGAAKAAAGSRAGRAAGRGAREFATSERAALDLTDLAEETGETALTKLTSTIRSAKPLQKQNQELLHQFRQRQSGAFQGAFQPGSGESGFQAGLSALRGQAERVTFEPLRPNLAQGDIDGFINTIGSSPLLPFEKVGAGTALRNILDGQVPTPSELVELEKVFPGVTKSLRAARIINGPALSEYVRDILSIPGSVVSSFDISGTRQVATYAAGHPVSFARQFRRSLDALRSESGFTAVQDDLASRWYAPLRKSAGVALADAERGLSKGEGTFISTAINKIPGYRPSQRQYAALLNLTRDDLFSKMLKSYGGPVAAIPEAELKRWGKFTNIATGRGTALDFLTGNQVFGQPLLWAPRLYASRLQFPLELLSASPTVRKEAARQLVSFVGINAALLKAGAAAGLWEVELDPRSADFGQMRIGRQRIDPWAGFRPFVNLTARLMTGERKSTNTGEINEVSRKDVAADFARSKLSPLVGTGVNLWTEEDFIGRPFDAKDAPTQLLTPLFARDLVEAVRNMGALGVPGAVLAGLGAGVTTYEESELDKLAGGSFYDADRTVRQRIKDEHPEAWQRAVGQGSPQRIEAESIKAEYEKMQAFDDERLRRGEISPEQHYKATIKRQGEAGLAASIPYRSLPDAERTPKNLAEEYNQKIGTNTLPNGEIDWDAVEAWRATLDETQNKYIDDNTNLGGTPEQRQINEFRRQMRQGGYWDLRNEAWSQFRQADARLSDLPADYYDWRNAEVRELALEGINAGYETGQAWQLAADKVSKYKTVTAFNEYYRKEHRHQWVVDNAELANKMWGYGIFEPDKEEEAFLQKRFTKTP